MICGWEGVVLLLASLRTVAWQSPTLQVDMHDCLSVGIASR